MKSEETNIEALSRTVLRDAHSDADKVLAEAKQKADLLMQEAAEQAKAKRAEILAQANREAQRIHSESISTAQLHARTMQLEQREKLLNEVFEEAQRQLETIQQGTDYEQITHLLLREALVQLGSDTALIHADKTSMKYLTKDALQKIAKEAGVKIQVGDALEQGIGIVAETLDKHRQFDNTLETRLHRFRDKLRLPVYHLLMGESL